MTTGPHGAEGVAANLTGDPKMNLTSIAIAPRDRIPLWIIC
jgi:hypothetical protein